MANLAKAAGILTGADHTSKKKEMLSSMGLAMKLGKLKVPPRFVNDRGEKANKAQKKNRCEKRL